MLEAIFKYFSLTTMLKIIDQTKVSASFAYDKYFSKSKKKVMGSMARIPIKKGAGIILESVSPNAEHLIQDDGDHYMLVIELPRFPLEKSISASELNELQALDDKEEQTQALSELIGFILKGHKDSFMTTIEFMCIGALFGKVVDGKGKVLFEFETTADTVEFKSNKTLVDSLNNIDDALVEELGTEAGYDILASREFITGITALATAEKLFEQNEAKWVDEDGKRVLVVHGKKFIPYTAKYKNTQGVTKRFIPSNEAIVTPHSEDVYKLYYGRANHVEAMSKTPTLFFSAKPEKLKKGAGYTLVSESRPLPVCVRPGALIKLKYTA